MPRLREKLRWRQKKPRAMRVSEILPKWYSLQRSQRLVDEAEVARAQQLSRDPVEFFRQIMGFGPTLLSSIHYNLEKLKNMNPMKIMKCREILAKLRSPRLHKFADHHAPYGRSTKYREALKKASIEKLAKILKALSFLAQTKVYLMWKT